MATKAGVQSSEDDGTNRPITYVTYDNLDEAVETQVYDGDGMTISTVDGVPQSPSASLLGAQEIDSYDDQGRVYQTQVYDVNPTTGAVSTNALTTKDYYDHRGDLIAESAPGGLWTKSVYDGAGRDVMDYTTDGAGGTTWADAGSVANDNVLEQVQTRLRRRRQRHRNHRQPTLRQCHGNRRIGYADQRRRGARLLRRVLLRQCGSSNGHSGRGHERRHGLDAARPRRRRHPPQRW